MQSYGVMETQQQENPPTCVGYTVYVSSSILVLRCASATGTTGVLAKMRNAVASDASIVIVIVIDSIRLARKKRCRLKKVGGVYKCKVGGEREGGW